jgi:N-carbamoylputrescine amidase
MFITVALLQMAACGSDQEANLSKGETYCRRAAAMGVDIALFPEMWNIGYSSYDLDGQNTRERWQAQAVERDGLFVSRFQSLAKELDMAIAITYLESWPDAPRNSVSLIDRHGKNVLTYGKVHTCDFETPEAACTPGDDFHVCTLDTCRGEVQVGAMICYDRESPESARILMLKGAELILTPNACTMEAHRIAQLRTRAYENMVGVALANYAVPQHNGHSLAFDPVVLDESHQYRDNLVVEAGEHEGVFPAVFDMERIRAYRKREIWGNAFRRPRRYHLLSSNEVKEPFLRNNVDGEVFNRNRR